MRQEPAIIRSPGQSAPCHTVGRNLKCCGVAGADPFGASNIKPELPDALANWSILEQLRWDEGWVREHPEQWLWLHRRWR
jgi:hypothetical protein